MERERGGERKEGKERGRGNASPLQEEKALN